MSAMSVCRILILNKSITPSNNSADETKIAIGSDNFSKNGILKTPAPKYSSSLNEKPTGSIAFTKPDAMKTKAIVILKTCFKIRSFLVLIYGFLPRFLSGRTRRNSACRNNWRPNLPTPKFCPDYPLSAWFLILFGKLNL